MARLGRSHPNKALVNTRLILQSVAAAYVIGRDSSVETTAVTTHDVDLVLGHQAGDIILIVANVFAVSTVTGPAGYTELINVSDASLGEYRGWYKVAAGGETTVQFTSGTAALSAHLTWAVRNASAPEAASVGGTSSSPNPPSLSPSGGLASYLFLATLVTSGTANLSGYPSGYAQGRFADADPGASFKTLDGAERNGATATEDPSNFSLTASQVWQASTISFGVYAAVGTAAVTQAGQTSTASGTVAIVVTGTVAVTQADQTSTAAAVETFTGTVAVTQAAQTSTASAVETITGTVAVTQAAQTSTASASETFTGTVAVTQADQTSTASGAESFTATAAVTQDDQTAIATGVFGSAVSGTVATTQADQTSTASGTIVINIFGTVAVIQADQTSTGTAVETFTGTSANVQADQTSTAVAVLGISGTASATQADQTSVANGTALVAVTGTVAVVQDDQFSTASGVGGILTFWSLNPVVFTRNPVSHVKAPVAFVKVGAGDDPPW